ncbi:ATP-dependent helicase HrpB [Marinomonas sargassi]|nr:ATP-dependent helicase HrpB [Marinomonas sargassi]
MLDQLPIYSLIPELKQQLREQNEAILEAAPGAGKTTVVPIELMDGEWVGSRKIIMLEPRRLAAKSAAKRLADTLNEPLGERVGYRIRHEGKESAKTKVLVVTEGVLTRMLQDDPSLKNIALVIFDEFHERNLHSDLAFALCLQARELYRDEDPLKLLVMSATLDTQALQKSLSCRVLSSQGRSFPVEIHYSNKALRINDVSDEVVRQTCHAVHNEMGSILVFLPGQKEIHYVASQLKHRLEATQGLHILPLYGNLSLKEQESVIAPAPKGERKIVLATSIAQTSLTIEGIRIVIDSGLSREARFDANTATTRLHTRRATQAETTQRMGRAGRIESGVCYRWWSADQQFQLASQAQPQIEISDLSNLVLDLAKWGVQDRLELDWVSPPPQNHWQQSIDHLCELGALTNQETLNLTPMGEAMGQLGIEPRLAHVLISGKRTNQVKQAAALCTILSEGDPFSQSGSDISSRLDWLNGSINDHGSRPKQPYLKAQASWEKRCLSLDMGPSQTNPAQPLSALLVCAYRDRIAHRVNQSSQQISYKLSNGRKAFLPSSDSCTKSEWLLSLEIGGQKDRGEDRIFLALPLDLQAMIKTFPHLIKKRENLVWSKKQGRLLSEEQSWIGKLCIATKPLSSSSEEAICQALCDYIQEEGIECLPWDNASKQLQARLEYAFKYDTRQAWPDSSNEALTNSIQEWLGPYLGKVTNQQALNKLPLKEALLSRLDWSQQQQLKQNVPERLSVPSGSSYAIDYCEEIPTLRVKLQEMFGCASSPTVLHQSIRVELLSPGQRPLAITQDLAFFWQEAYPEVRKEMRGRYPKHPWPDNPMEAQATGKTNRALRSS